MRPQELREIKNWRKAGLCGSPAVFHVLGFVHPYGQFDLQILVRTCLSDSHLMKFWLFGAVGSWMEDDLQSQQNPSHMSPSVGVFTADIHMWLTFKTIIINKTEYRRVGPVSQRTTAFLPKTLQQHKKESCHKPKVTVTTGASQEHPCLALPFFTVTLHLQKG